MKTVTWEHKGNVTTDYYFLWWFQLSKHARKQRMFGWEFHWKGSTAWYHNFRRHSARKFIEVEENGKMVKKEIDVGTFSRCRLTIRFGRRFLIVGTPNQSNYYRDVKVLQIRKWGLLHDKVLLPHVGQIMITHDKGIGKAGAGRDVEKDYWHLSKDYPSDTWRN